MQTNGNGNGNSLNQLPIFKGVNYHFWSLKMKTLFKSQELWSTVESGFEDDATEEPDQALREKRKKDAKALFIIQQSLDDEVFPRIAAASTAKEAWSTLKADYMGDKKVVNVRLQSLRREFETCQMKEKETAQEYLSRISDIVHQMRTLGEEVKETNLVSKVLRSLTNKYDHVVTAIEESKDMEKYTFDELKGSLQAHGERMCKREDKKEEKAFQAKGDSSRGGSGSQSGSGRGRGRGGFRGRGSGRGGSSEGRDQSSQGSKGSFKCYYCKKPGHKEATCWKKEEDEAKGDQKSNFVEQEQKLFLAQNASSNDAGGVWYIDSGCSNHMSSVKFMFRDLDESQRSKVRIGDGKQLDVEGRGSVAFKTEQEQEAMGWYKRSQLSLSAIRNVSVGTNHQARNPASSPPISGKISRLSDEWSLGFRGSSLVSQTLSSVLVRATKRPYKFPNFKPSRFEKWIEKPRNFLLALLLGSGITVYLCNLERVPYTNRTRFVFMSIQTEIIYGKLSLESLKQGLFKGRVLPANHPDSVRVKSIAENVIQAFQKGMMLQNDPKSGSQNLVKASLKNNKCLSFEYNFGARSYTRGLERLEWEIAVVNSPTEVNTLLFIGGKILVFSGVLKHFQTDAEIAFFIAHEVGHAVARHLAENMTKDIWKYILQGLLSHFVRPDLVEKMTLLDPTPYYTSPELEMEAHNIALMLMATAGYDPSTTISTYEKLTNLTRHSPDPPCILQARVIPETDAMEQAMHLYRAKVSGRGSNQGSTSTCE